MVKVDGDPELVVFQPQTLEEVIGAGIAQERFAALLLSVFGGLAVLLAGLGPYGVLSHLVARQQRVWCWLSRSAVRSKPSCSR